jgi:predicted transposase YbfD/YdcC
MKGLTSLLERPQAARDCQNTFSLNRMVAYGPTIQPLPPTSVDAFQKCFIAWVGSLTKLGPEIIAIDGKTLRRSYQEGGGKAPIHMISAFSSRQRMVLGQRKVADKSNEITAIPELIDLLTVKGAIITIDALVRSTPSACGGCQKEIAAKIIDRQADYVLALKGNEGKPRDDVELFFTEQKERGFADAAMSRNETLEKSHGRIETRTYSAIDATGWLTKRHGFASLKSIVMVESIREIIGGKSERETRYYTSSLKADAERQGDAIRSHWAVESHHWVMDMVFRDDECRIRRDNAPANFATIKHIASNLMRIKADKHSMRAKRCLAAWDNAFLASLITGAT